MIRRALFECELSQGACGTVSLPHNEGPLPMRDDIEWLKANSQGRAVRGRLDETVRFLRAGEVARGAVWGYCNKWGLLLATTQRLLFVIPGAPEASGADYDVLENIEVEQAGPRSLTAHAFATTFSLVVERVTDVPDLQRVVGAASEGIEQANAAAGRLLRFAKITVTATDVSSPWGSGPLAGAHVNVDTEGNLTRRPRVGAVLVFGVLGLAASKTVDQREVFVSVEGQGFGFAVQLPPWRAAEARTFASRFNGIQAEAAMPMSSTAERTTPTPQDDPFDQLRKLGELREADLISQEQFDAKRVELLGRI
jgi:hypothetical protein